MVSNIPPSSRIIAIINQRSGSVPEDGGELLSAALTDLGFTADINVVNGPSLLDAMIAAIANGPDILIVWGGDGTIACALRHAGANGPAILALPGGTMNMLHQAVHFGRTDWRDVLTLALHHGEPRALAGGRAGDHAFFVAAVFGNLSKLAISREYLREGRVLTAFGQIADNHILDTEEYINIELFPAGKERDRRRAMALGAMLPAMTDPEGFEVGLITPGSIGDLLKVGAESLLSGWRDAHDVEYIRTPSFSIRTEKAQDVPCTFDGEPVMLPSGTTITYQENVASILSAPA